MEFMNDKVQVSYMYIDEEDLIETQLLGCLAGYVHCTMTRDTAFKIA